MGDEEGKLWQLKLQEMHIPINRSEVSEIRSAISAVGSRERAAIQRIPYCTLFLRRNT